MSAITNRTPRAIKRSTLIKHFGSISGMPPSRSPRLSLLNVRDNLPIPGGTLVEAQPK
jgi:hypothetical protein